MSPGREADGSSLLGRKDCEVQHASAHSIAKYCKHKQCQLSCCHAGGDGSFEGCWVSILGCGSKPTFNSLFSLSGGSRGI